MEETVAANQSTRVCIFSSRMCKNGVNQETLLNETSIDRDVQKVATLKFVNQGDNTAAPLVLL